ncbi:MAG TPA: hypothetical protein VFB68_14295 [Xanthobacteraceae bacterium]|nr:hypothetical protein [Xanthobacteraceae bacterium]
MQRVSSRNTFFLKRFAPIIAFGGLLLFLALPFIGGRPPLAWLFISAGLVVFVGAVGWFILKQTVFDLADQVFDDGDTLLVRKDDQDERISLADITAVRHGSFFVPLRVTLSLRKPSRFGSEIAFLPASGALPFVRAPAFRNLMTRIDAKRTP